jgi:hypothetical protein
VRVSWKRELKPLLEEIFDGAMYRPILERIEAIHQKPVLRSRVFVALHMHAGDGNVHTNIPVNSDNYDMLQEPMLRSPASWRWRVRLTASFRESTASASPSSNS